MKEKDLVKKIKDYLTEKGYIVFKYHGSIYGEKGHSDLYGVCPGGRAFFIEVKTPKNFPTQLQSLFLERMGKAGALVGWADNVEQVRNNFK